MSLPRMYRRRGEEGAALPLAIAFLLICSLLASAVIDYTGTSNKLSAKNASERRNFYAAEGAVDAAIKWVQSDTLFNIGQPGNCPTFTTPVDGTNVSVTCAPSTGGSGGGSDTTMSPVAVRRPASRALWWPRFRESLSPRIRELFICKFSIIGQVRSREPSSTKITRTS